MTSAEHALRAQELLSQALEALAEDYPAEALRHLAAVEHEARAACEAIQREAREHLAREAAALGDHHPLLFPLPASSVPSVP